MRSNDDDTKKLMQDMQDRGTELFKQKLAQGIPFTEELIQEVSDQVRTYATGTKYGQCFALPRSNLN